MNQHNDTPICSEKQGEVANWVEQIKSMLPKDLDETAKLTGALVRKRGVKSAFDLLRLLLIYAVSTMSICMLSLSARSLELADISDTAMRKRFANSTIWLAYILDSVLPIPAKPPLRNKKYGQERTVHLVDGSNVAIAGKSGELWRIHMSYNLSIASMGEIKVTDKHTSEGFSHYTIEKGHIYIADTGYGKAKMLEYVTKRGGDVILRCTPNHVTLVDANGKTIEMTQKLDKDKQIVEFSCYAVHGKKKLPVRIVASQLPEDKKADAVKRKKRQAQKCQTKNMRPETLVYAEWVIIMTSLDISYTAEEILTIYRSRWQVELLFKRIKQHFKVTKIRPSSLKYGQALVLLWLIIWALVERQVCLAEIYLIEKGMEMCRFSPWMYSSYFFNRLKTMIESLWATILDPIADIEAIAKKLQDHKRHDRLNHYFEYHLKCFLELNDCNITDNMARAA